MGESSMTEYDGWAPYYDLIHKGVPGEAEFYTGQAVRRAGKTLEIGCGTGRIAIPMAMSGVDVTGMDISPAMLEVCREKLDAVGEVPGRLELVEADMADFDLGNRFDFIAIPYRTFMHLLTQEKQRSCLRCVRRHLAEDGLFAFNVWAARPSAIVPHLGGEGQPKTHFAGEYDVPEMNLALTHYFSAVYDEYTQRLVETHWVQELDRQGREMDGTTLSLTRAWTTYREMDNLVRLCGFKPDAVLGDFDCTPFNRDSTEMVWLLHRD